VSKLLLSFSLALTITGCANIPRSDMPESGFSSLDCSAIAGQMDQAQATRQHAAEAKRSSWKVIIPIAIGVRYFNASHVENEAEKREAQLLQEQKTKGCTQVSGAAEGAPSMLKGKQLSYAVLLNSDNGLDPRAQLDHAEAIGLEMQPPRSSRRN
jgi:hypothetical protein